MKYCSFVLLLFLFSGSFGQQNDPGNKKTHTLGFYSGTGYAAVRHEVIDKDRYDGIIIPLGIEWEKQSLKISRKIFVSFNAGNIKSDIDDADIKNITIGMDYSFSLNNTSHEKNTPVIYAGPSLYIYTHMREQERIDLYDCNHTLGMIAAGPNLGIKGSISRTVNYSGMFRMNVLSFGGHDNYSTAFLSPLKGFHSSALLAVDWKARERTGFFVSYRFDYSNINEWVDFIAGSDMLLMGINLKL